MALTHVALSSRLDVGTASAVAEATKAMRDKSCMMGVANLGDSTRPGWVIKEIWKGRSHDPLYILEGEAREDDPAVSHR